MNWAAMQQRFFRRPQKAGNERCCLPFLCLTMPHHPLMSLCIREAIVVARRIFARIEAASLVAIVHPCTIFLSKH